MFETTVNFEIIWDDKVMCKTTLKDGKKTKEVRRNGDGRVLSGSSPRQDKLSTLGSKHRSASSELPTSGPRQSLNSPGSGTTLRHFSSGSECSY
jgi:hypothetical protein